MQQRWMMVAGGLGALAVLLGAFGAHALRDWLETVPDGARRLEWWRTAAHYQLVHSLAIGLAAVSGRAGGLGRAGRVAPWAFVLGLTLFSGSLYAMTVTGLRGLGALTPVGGVALVVGWLALAVSARTPSGA